MESEKGFLVKCAHCQQVHHRNYVCDKIHDLLVFVGHFEWKKKNRWYRGY